MGFGGDVTMSATGIPSAVQFKILFDIDDDEGVNGTGLIGPFVCVV